LEFFCSPQMLDELVQKFNSDLTVSYYAVNMKGELLSNSPSEGPNAVTWGVFAGKEIVQPTVVEVVSFMAWKDEAFGLGKEWANFYDETSPSYKLINSIMDSYYLVNVVHNDYPDPDPFAIFDFFQHPTASASPITSSLSSPVMESPSQSRQQMMGNGNEPLTQVEPPLVDAVNEAALGGV